MLDILLTRLEDELRIARDQQAFHRASENEKELVRWSKIAASIEQCINDVRMA